jgi:hypothetical protein
MRTADTIAAAVDSDWQLRMLIFNGGLMAALKPAATVEDDDNNNMGGNNVESATRY